MTKKTSNTTNKVGDKANKFKDRYVLIQGDARLMDIGFLLCNLEEFETPLENKIPVYRLTLERVKTKKEPK